MSSSQTLFGSPWGRGPYAAAAVLRAQAGRSVELEQLSLTDALACVLGAHVWCAATSETSLTASHRHTRPVIEAAARILGRASGHGETYRAGESFAAAGDCSSEVTAAVDAGEQWVREWVTAEDADDMVSTVLRLASADLGSDDEHLCSAAWLLSMRADLVGSDD